MYLFLCWSEGLQVSYIYLLVIACVYLLTHTFHEFSHHNTTWVPFSAPGSFSISLVKHHSDPCQDMENLQQSCSCNILIGWQASPRLLSDADVGTECSTASFPYMSGRLTSYFLRISAYAMQENQGSWGHKKADSLPEGSIADTAAAEVNSEENDAPAFTRKGSKNLSGLALLLCSLGYILMYSYVWHHSSLWTK